MAIKRFTIELDDSNDSYSATGRTIHVSNGEKDFKENETAILEEYKTSENSKTDKITLPGRTIGRTFGDILVEFKNDPRVMVTLIFAVSFLIFMTKLDSIQQFIYPLTLGTILTLIWFMVPSIEKKIKGKKT